MIPKFSAEDTFLDTKNSKGENVTVVVPKGTYLTINTPALHYNRQCFSFTGYWVTSRSRIFTLFQHVTGRILTNSIHLGSLAIGHGMRSFRSVMVSVSF
jgi:hypothetical protein